MSIVEIRDLSTRKIVGPKTDRDMFSDDLLLEPHEFYRSLRDAGPAVWSTLHNTWLMSRFEDVKKALNDHETYTSGQGVGLFKPANEAMRGTVIASDPPDHAPLRRVLAERMSPRGIRAIQDDVEAKAEALVGELVARRQFDAVPELSQKFPLMVVANLIGLPDDDHHELLLWADSGFNTFGPANERTISSMPKFGEMMGYIGTLDADPTRLKPGSMGREIYEAAGRGEISLDQCGRLMVAYLMAGLDTTIASITSLVWLFGRNPEQWDIIRKDPSRIPHAYNEILRIETPIQTFGRTLSRDVTIGDASMHKGDSVLLLYASANLDERHYESPERFDVNRRAGDHLALGSGIHNCAGQGLARLEAHAIMGALARKVARFDLGEPRRHLNNLVRTLESLPVTLHE
jgi:cytochrome P450